MKTKKDLAKYLADYVVHEIDSNPDTDNLEPVDVLEQGLEAFESTENVKIDMQVVEDDLCNKCKKCGETTCGNDTTNHACFEEIE